ncbi:MAG: lipoyl(octanoyl) transferase LipB [Gammaproteobacteria bacterium]
MPQTLIVRHLGRRDYGPVWQAMQGFTAQRGAATPDELWLLEHPPVYTLGLGGREEHVLAPGPIPVLRCDRGGQVTYHGPGQLVAYLLLDLRRRTLGIRQLVHDTEAALMHLLTTYGIAGRRRQGAPGVYVGEAKLAALGFRVHRGCCYHGLSLNIAMDLEPFQRINPCGYAGLTITQLSDLGGPTDTDQVANDLTRQLAQDWEYVTMAADPPNIPLLQDLHSHEY